MDEKKGIAEAMKEEVEAYKETQFGGDGDDGTELDHIALDPEDAEVE